MATPWRAATTGLGEVSTTRMTVCSDGSAVIFGVPNSLMSAPPENPFPEPTRTMAWTARSAADEPGSVGGRWGGGALEPSGGVPPQGMAEPVHRRVVQGNDGHRAARLVF